MGDDPSVHPGGQKVRQIDRSISFSSFMPAAAPFREHRAFSRGAYIYADVMK